MLPPRVCAFLVLVTLSGCISIPETIPAFRGEIPPAEAKPAPFDFKHWAEVEGLKLKDRFHLGCAPRTVVKNEIQSEEGGHFDKPTFLTATQLSPNSDHWQTRGVLFVPPTIVVYSVRADGVALTPWQLRYVWHHEAVHLLHWYWGIPTPKNGEHMIEWEKWMFALGWFPEKKTK